MPAYFHSLRVRLPPKRQTVIHKEAGGHLSAATRVVENPSTHRKRLPPYKIRRVRHSTAHGVEYKLRLLCYT